MEDSRVNRLLERLPALRELSLSTHQNSTPFVPSFLLFNHLENVSKIHWNDRFLTVDVCTKFILLKSIKQLNVEHLLNEPVPDTEDCRPVGSSPFTGLMFG
jgi:hypothetical protein